MSHLTHPAEKAWALIYASVLPGTGRLEYPCCSLSNKGCSHPTKLRKDLSQEG